MTHADDPAHDHHYPPVEWSVEELTAAIEEADGDPPIPTYDDADVWRDLREDDALSTVLDALHKEAEGYRDGPIPRVGAREFERVAATGRKSRAYYETLRRQRRAPTVLALVECLDREERYLDAVSEYVWALCEQTSWLNPRQLDPGEAVENLPRPPREVAPETHNLTHYTAWTAHELAEIDHLLGDRLHPALRDRLRTEIDLRVFEPYEAREDCWWLTEASNWNAVCNARTALAALYLETDPDRLGRIVTKAVHSLEHYLDCFDADGSTPEGVMYWDYGMRYYTEFAAYLEARTGGEYSLFDPPVIRESARFPHRVGFGPGRYPPFNDSLERYALRPSTLFWLGDRFDFPAVSAHGWRVLTADSPESDLHNFPPWDAPSLVWSRLADDAVRADATAERYAPPAVTFFGGNDWWVARADPTNPDATVVAAKGGHNGEPHNHNDCGSVVVHTERESLLADLGAPSYSRDYGGDGRYEFLAARSLGHSVPLVDGCEQVADHEFGARVVERTTDDTHEKIAFDLAGCYPDTAGLDSLRRTVSLDRTTETVTIADDALFEGSGRDLESVLVSYRPIETEGDGLVVTGIHGGLRIETDGKISTVEHLTDALDTSYRDGFAENSPDVWRVRIGASMADSHTIQVVARPEPRN